MLLEWGDGFYKSGLHGTCGKGRYRLAMVVVEDEEPFAKRIGEEVERLEVQLVPLEGSIFRHESLAVRDPNSALEVANLRGSIEQGGGEVRASFERRPGFFPVKWGFFKEVLRTI
ncbi:hypothetical protein CK203_053084 [Vitis vinifera]|uniref:Uncharacterized protein n=1 Tax=Vitis vinifera TaxID=29760 RepID=A0A438GL74_VITVI|nr:hypothetical protein CK203_053084 [Vitis vinifera]